MKKVIMQLTGISDEIYSKILFESGIAFAEFYFGFDQEAIGLITGGKAYWNWYRNQFGQICQQFCAMHGSSDAPRPLMRRLFEGMLHPLRQIAYPGQYVIDAAINEMMSELWRERRLENHIALNSHVVAEKKNRGGVSHAKH